MGLVFFGADLSGVARYEMHANIDKRHEQL